MDPSDLLNINIDDLKKKVAEKLGITIAQLDEEIEKIKIESKGWVGDRTALLLLLERWGVSDKDLFEDIVMNNSIMNISELGENIRNASIIGRIMRIFPESFSKNKNPFMKLIIDDGTGKAILVLFGKALENFKKQDFKVGDVILLRRIRVQKRFGEYLSLVANDNSRLDRPDEEKYANIISSLPDEPIILSVYELIDTEAILEEGDEVNVKGIVDIVSEIRSFTRKDGSEGKVLNIILADEDVPGQTIRVVAWDNMAEWVQNNIKPGDIVQVLGGRVRFNVDMRGERRLEVHLTKLSSILKIGVKHRKISELTNNIEEKVVIYGVIVNSPTLRIFERDGESVDFATLRVADDTGSIRVVIWDPRVREIVQEMEEGKIVRIYGRVKENNGRLEVHVSKINNLIVGVETDLGSLNVEDIVNKYAAGSSLETGIELDNFRNVMSYSFVNIIGQIEFFNIPDSERMPWELIIADKEGNRIKVLGWDRELINEIQNYGVGSIVRITNLRVSSDKVSGESALKVTQRTSIEKLDEGYSVGSSVSETEFMDAKSLLKKKESRKTSYLSELDLMADEAEVIASIVKINENGSKRFCTICGAPIISEEGVCENGHINEGTIKKYVSVLIYDGVKSYEAIITDDIFEELNSGKDLIDSVQSVLGIDLKITVKPKVKADGKVYLIVKKIEKPDHRELLEEIVEKIIEKQLQQDDLDI